MSDLLFESNGRRKMIKDNEKRVVELPKRRISALKSIRLKCMDCCIGQVSEIRACGVVNCPLWNWRLGINPFSEKGKKNPFYNTTFFAGLEDLSANETIKEVKRKIKKENIEGVVI